MLNEAITNDACCILVCGSAEQKENSEPNVICPICNGKFRVSLTETHVDICLRIENNECTVVPDIIISDDESDDKSFVRNCETEIQKEERCLGSKKIS